ncbi:hypothetical protein BHUM_00715c [Candidatus Burkholderia humilis]|nr:hypothetical protein BHUM_00715c [Candidatus Burkholderia humilis]
MEKPSIVIAGAGPCGIGAALTLRQEYPSTPFVLIDERDRAGGNAASEITPEGFVFDYGGHVLFIHERYAAFSAMLRSLDIASTNPCRFAACICSANSFRRRSSGTFIAFRPRTRCRSSPTCS